MDFKPIETQEQLDSIIKERIERAKNSVIEQYKDYETYKSNAEKFQKDIDTLNGKIAEKDTEINRLNSEVKNYEISTKKNELCTKYGIPVGFAGRISGSNEEEIIADIQSLKELLGNTQPVAPLGSTEGGESKDDNESYKRLLKNIRKEN